MAGEKRLYRTVLTKMQDLIARGDFPMGGRLPPERELAARFNVSRPTIREAIIALEAVGLVEVKTGSGIYVLNREVVNGGANEDISPFELTEARALIEGEAAALAASHITDDELESLKQSLVAMTVENERGDLASGDADRQFHRVIAQATRNQVIVSMIDNMWHIRDNTPQVFSAYKAICEQDGLRRVEEHQEIYEALRMRDATAARTAMHRHFARILNKLIATTEAEQVEKLKRQTQEVRKRFSLDHLISTP